MYFAMSFLNKRPLFEGFRLSAFRYLKVPVKRGFADADATSGGSRSRRRSATTPGSLTATMSVTNHAGTRPPVGSATGAQLTRPHADTPVPAVSPATHPRSDLISQWFHAL